MSSITQTTLTIDQIDLSRLNVRSHQLDANAVASIEASILERGLIHAINLHPLAGSKKYGAFAGGRRYRAIRNLVARADLPADWPVKVAIYEGHSDVEIIELSLGENMLRRDLREFEICAAIARLAQRGETVDAIADALGQDRRFIAQRMRVGQLAAPIFETLAQGLLAVDDACAYAATSDHQLQLVTFEELRVLPEHMRTPAKIRAAMKVGDRAGSKMLRLVGPDAYRAAGGSFEMDLFADEVDQRGRVVDEGLLRKLAEERLIVVRDETRAATGRPDLRFVAKPPEGSYGSTDETLRASPRLRADGGLILPEGDVVAWIDLSEAGEPQVTYWWESRKARAAGAGAAPKPLSRPERPAGAAIDDRASPGATRQADEAIREETGIAPATIQIFRSLRRVIMRAMLVRDARAQGTVGLDYLVWSQLRMMLRQEHPTAIGMRAIGALEADTDEARAEVQATDANHEWRHALHELSQQSFITGDDRADAFLDYRASAPTLKLLAAAAVAGLALERSLNGETYQLPVHDAVAGELRTADDAAIRSLWTPSAALLDRIPAHHRLAIADPFVERVTFGAWQRLKSADLTSRVLDMVLGRSASAKASMAKAAATWVHPLLQFNAPQPDDQTSAAAAQLEEAA